MKRSATRLGWAAVVTAILLMPAAVSAASEAKAPPGKILRLISVGGVLTEDGTIWQYRPDRHRWQTIDESFAGEGKTTHILPLPVPAASIRNMVTFGFLQTEEGDLWLYDIGKDKWDKLPPPPER
jgi:hypothetical protein